MSIFSKLAGGAAIAILVPACYAAPAAEPLNMLTAPDVVSRAILARPTVHFEDGATSRADIPAAIHRNYPHIIEQSFARMNARSTRDLIDALTDVELTGIAQLYANGNADAHRDGALLLVAADRMDSAHLARISKFFGYAPVYDAITKVAPLKAQGFAQNASIMYAAPVAGGHTPMMALIARSNASAAAVRFAPIGDGTFAPMQTFKPAVSMTFEELYTGFRSLQVGSMATTGALYETAVYSGQNLGTAAAIGWSIGTGLTWVAQTYCPDWYYGTFVPAVGNSVTWFQNTTKQVGTFYGTSIYDLGHYEATIAPVMSVPTPVQHSMMDTGGDFGVTAAWNVVYINGQGGCGRTKCPPVMSH